MQVPAHRLRSLLRRFSRLTFAEAYARVVEGDPLQLRALAALRLAASAHWLPREVVFRRSARNIASDLASLPGVAEVHAWIDEHIDRAIPEACHAESSTDPAEVAAWEAHRLAVADRIGIEPADAEDWLHILHARPAGDRRLILRGMELLEARAQKSWQEEQWADFTRLLRGLVRSLHEER